MLSRYSDLVLFFLTVSLATHRSSAKLLAVLAQIFMELAQKVRTVYGKHLGAVGTQIVHTHQCWGGWACFGPSHSAGGGMLSLWMFYCCVWPVFTKPASTEVLEPAEPPGSKSV